MAMWGGDLSPSEHGFGFTGFRHRMFFGPPVCQEPHCLARVSVIYSERGARWRLYCDQGHEFLPGGENDTVVIRL